MLKSKLFFLNTQIVEIIKKHFPEDIISEAIEKEIYAGLSKNEGNNFSSTTYFSSYLLNETDETIALLALSRYLYPVILNKYRTIQLSFQDIQFIGGRLSDTNKAFIPTLRTALFTLAGLDLCKHIEIAKNHFHTSSPLFKLNILKPVHNNSFEEDTILECTPEFIYKITKGEEYQYSYRADFPATLYSTNETWEDLYLNDRESMDLLVVKSWLKNYTKLTENLLLGKSHKGYKALFFGPSGTGKTVSVGLLGKEIDLPVYRIDLSQLISKWVGETEKNLKYIFDLAANKNWIIFFDEGDAIFGKRSDNAGSNDHNRNQEIAYLLQRMEEHEGIIFLCTNKQHNMDDAFRRRFNSRVEFFIPNKQERFDIWKKYTNQLDVDLEDNDLRKLAEKIQISGAAIKNFCKWMTILQYENLHKTAEQIEKKTKITKSQFLELMNNYFVRYEGQSLDKCLFY